MAGKTSSLEPTNFLSASQQCNRENPRGLMMRIHKIRFYWISFQRDSCNIPRVFFDRYLSLWSRILYLHNTFYDLDVLYCMIMLKGVKDIQSVTKLWFSFLPDRPGEHWLYTWGWCHTSLWGGEISTTNGGERDQRERGRGTQQPNEGQSDITATRVYITA